MTNYWTPSIMTPIPGVKWRVLKSGDDWYEIECKNETKEHWEFGLAGTQKWLGLTDQECIRAYPKKKKLDN